MCFPWNSCFLLAALHALQAGQLSWGWFSRLGDSLALPTEAAAQKPVGHEVRILISGVWGLFPAGTARNSGRGWCIQASGGLLLPPGKGWAERFLWSKFSVLPACRSDYYVQSSELDTLDKTVKLLMCVDKNYSLPRFKLKKKKRKKIWSHASTCKQLLNLKPVGGLCFTVSFPFYVYAAGKWKA